MKHVRLKETAIFDNYFALFSESNSLNDLSLEWVTYNYNYSGNFGYYGYESPTKKSTKVNETSEAPRITPIEWF